MTEMEEDTGSWKERCDRYFTSLTDTDVRQDNNDKDTKNGKSDTHNDNTAEKDSWKNLSEFKQDTNRMLRLKKVLHVLDIHGTRILCAGKHWLECVLWFMIISASLAVLVYVIYLQVTDYQKQVNERTFETVAIQNDAMNSERPLVSSLNSARPLVSFCNRNTLKKSAVSGTRFADLANMDSGIVTSQHEHASIKDTPSNVLKSNHKLNSLLKEQLGDELDRFMRELEDDISIKLLSESSNTSLLYSLAMAGTSDILLRYLQPSRTEIQEIGHKMKDMLVRCIVDGRDCRER